MSYRKGRPSSIDLLEDEFAHEKASALGRLGRALEATARGMVDQQRHDTQTTFLNTPTTRP